MFLILNPLGGTHGFELVSLSNQDWRAVIRRLIRIERGKGCMRICFSLGLLSARESIIGFVHGSLYSSISLASLFTFSLTFLSLIIACVCSLFIIWQYRFTKPIPTPLGRSLPSRRDTRKEEG